MSIDADLAEAKTKFDKCLAQLAHEFKGIRTGRATTAIVENIQVEAYGNRMPLPQVAGITVPDASTIMIKPWDASVIRHIEKAISEANLGLTPQSDGKIIRLSLPPLAQERRKQLAEQAKDACEKAKVSMRNVRRDAIKHIETKGKELKLPEDAVKKTVEKVGDLLKQSEAKAEAELKSKQTDILTF
jgi:ribosome recycling factor